MQDFQIEEYAELESTNTLALQYARENKTDGTVIRADFQTSGRGKPGRTWVSSSGKDLLFSLLIRPNISVNEAPMITQLACRSVAKVIQDSYDLEITFKRPNDLLIGTKKICGILTESISSGRTLEAVVIGIGLNVNSHMNELPETATSLALATERSWDIQSLFRDILSRLKKDLEPLYASTS